MRRNWTIGVLAIAAAFAFVPAAAQASTPHKGTAAHRHAGSPSHRTYIRSVGRGERALYTTGRKGHMIDLVGDPESGFGFYPLPVRYRIGAARYRATHPRPPWDNPVLFAIAADASRYYDWIPTNQGYRYGVFNPEDGVGTPFFGGYYGSGD